DSRRFRRMARVTCVAILLSFPLLIALIFFCPPVRSMSMSTKLFFPRRGSLRTAARRVDQAEERLLCRFVSCSFHALLFSV
ncbi:hypothetical protein PFISCL1PPCAC_1268, partial [Pristionchus fissidentatus]